MLQKRVAHRPLNGLVIALCLLPGLVVAVEAQGESLPVASLIRYVTHDDFDGFVDAQIRMGTVEKTP